MSRGAGSAASAGPSAPGGRRGRPSTHREIGCAFTPKSSGDPDFVLAHVRAGRERVPVGCGRRIVSRTYVGDIGPGVERALEREQARGEAFNLCERRSPTLRLWAEQILDTAGSRTELVGVPEERLPPDLAMTGAGRPLLACSAKARVELDWCETDPHVRSSDPSTGISPILRTRIGTRTHFSGLIADIAA